MDDLLSAFSLSQSQSQPDHDSYSDDEEANYNNAGDSDGIHERESDGQYGLDMFSDTEDEQSDRAGAAAAAADDSNNFATPMPSKRKRRGFDNSAAATGVGGGRIATHFSTRSGRSRATTGSKTTRQRRRRRPAGARVCKLCGQALKGHTCPFKRPRPPSRPQVAALRLQLQDRERFGAVASLLVCEMQRGDWPGSSACLALLLRHYNSLRVLPQTALCPCCLFLCSSCQVIAAQSRTQLPLLCEECRARAVMNPDLYAAAATRALEVGSNAVGTSSNSTVGSASSSSVQDDARRATRLQLSPTVAELLRLRKHMLDQLRQRLAFRTGRASHPRLPANSGGMMRKKILATTIASDWTGEPVEVDHSQERVGGSISSTVVAQQPHLPSLNILPAAQQVIGDEISHIGISPKPTLPPPTDHEPNELGQSNDLVQDCGENEDSTERYRYLGYSAPDLMATFRSSRHTSTWSAYHTTLQSVAPPAAASAVEATMADVLVTVEAAAGTDSHSGIIKKHSLGLDATISSAGSSGVIRQQSTSRALTAVASGASGEFHCSILWQAFIEVLSHRDKLRGSDSVQTRTRFLRKIRSFDKPHAGAAVLELALHHIDAGELEACSQLLGDAVGGGWLGRDLTLEALSGCVMYWLWKSQRDEDLLAHVDGIASENFSGGGGSSWGGAQQWRTPTSRFASPLLKQAHAWYNRPQSGSFGRSPAARHTAGKHRPLRSNGATSPRKRRRATATSSSAGRLKLLLDAIKRCLPAATAMGSVPIPTQSHVQPSISPENSVVDNDRSETNLDPAPPQRQQPSRKQQPLLDLPAHADQPSSCMAEMYVLTGQFEASFNFLRAQVARFRGCPSVQGRLLKFSSTFLLPAPLTTSTHQEKQAEEANSINNVVPAISTVPEAGSGKGSDSGSDSDELVWSGGGRSQRDNVPKSAYEVFDASRSATTSSKGAAFVAAACLKQLRLDPVDRNAFHLLFHRLVLCIRQQDREQRSGETFGGVRIFSLGKLNSLDKNRHAFVEPVDIVRILARRIELLETADTTQAMRFSSGTQIGPTSVSDNLFNAVKLAAMQRNAHLDECWRLLDAWLSELQRSDGASSGLKADPMVSRKWWLRSRILDFAKSVATLERRLQDTTRCNNLESQPRLEIKLRVAQYIERKQLAERTY